MRRTGKWMMTAAVAAALGGPAAATVVQWADLTSYNSATGTVTGTIDVNGTAVGVTVQVATPAGISFAQVDGTGTNYWVEGNPKPYTGGSVSNAPGTTDIVAFNEGGFKTITFSQAVSDVYLALVSWNGNSGTFDQPFTVVSQGCGYWGCGTFADVTSNSFYGSGELHGVIAFNGTFTQTTFTDVSENWHGIEIGIAGLAPPPVTTPTSNVPEPASWALLVAGFGLVGAALRRAPAARVAFG